MTEDVKISETPHVFQGSFDSIDSGYLSLTPQSNGSRSTRTGTISTTKRPYWLRSDQWSDRRRSKFTSLIYSSDNSDSFIEQSPEKSENNINNTFDSQLNNGRMSMDRNEFRAELRDYRTRARRNQRISAAITPASRLPILSPPISPAIPSANFVACEPIDALQKQKSTPFDNNYKACINFSPKTSRCITTDDHKKLRNLRISEFITIPEIKPKRLDFDSNYNGYYSTRITPDYTGRKTVDILSLLSEKSNYWRVTEKILGHLSPQDLCAVSMVSRAWRKICNGDSAAHVRRLNHVFVRQNTKENLKMICAKGKLEEDVEMSPKTRFARKGYLVAVQNLLSVQPRRKTPSSPPVSPSKVKFHSFVKVSYC